MALLWLEGFDWVDQSVSTGLAMQSLFNVKAHRPTDFSSFTDAQMVPGRAGRGGAVFWEQTQQYTITPNLRDPNVDSDMITGFAMKTGASFTDNQNWLLVYINGDIQTLVRYETSDNTFRFFRANGTLLSTSPANLLDNSVWSFIEVKQRISDTNGFLVMRINGQVVWETATNLDTRDTNLTEPGSNLFWNLVQFFPGRLSDQCTTDDWYVCDSSGTENNDFLGDIAIDTLFPAADGDFTQWTKNTGATHVEHIDDAPFTADPDDTDYLETNVLNGKSLFEYDALPASNPRNRIYGVQACPVVKITDAFPRGMQQVARSKNHELLEDGTNHMYAPFGDNKVRSEDQYLIEKSIFEREPRNSERWTPERVNDTQFGIELNS